MDVVPNRAGPPSGNRGLAVVRQIGASAPVPDRIIHAGRKPGRRSVQERDIRGWPQPPVVDQRRGWFTRAAGDFILYLYIYCRRDNVMI